MATGDGDLDNDNESMTGGENLEQGGDDSRRLLRNMYNLDEFDVDTEVTFCTC